MTKICQAIIVAICLLITVPAYAQTTETEYNYVTKGYKSQMEHGLDMKKGYRFEDGSSWKEYYNNRSFYRETSFKLLYRENEKIPCAILMKLKRSDTTYESYLCIPHHRSSSNIWKRAKQDFVKSTHDWTPASRGYVWGMLKMISFQCTGSAEVSDDFMSEMADYFKNESSGDKNKATKDMKKVNFGSDKKTGQ